MTNLKDALAEAQSLLATDFSRAEQLIALIIRNPSDDEESMRVKENAFVLLTETYEKQRKPEKMQELAENITAIINSFSKAKAAKLIKILLDTIERMDAIAVQTAVCEFLVKWCITEKRNFLRHRIELRLATLLWRQHQYNRSLEMTHRLLGEMKTVDDKHLLLELHLLEAKIQHSLENIPKAKASLTSARAAANSIYCPPQTQAELDLMSGVLYSEEKDYQTAYSYFYEAFEAFNTFDERSARQTLKYMILSKIMVGNVDEAFLILGGKSGMKYWGKELEAMKAITQANKSKSLRKFQEALQENEATLREDPLIKIHINNLYENLLEQNLLKVVEPYSRVQIEHVAKQLNLPGDVVQRKLSEMILDKKVDGTLDQGNGCLIVFDEIKADKLFANATDVMTNMNGVVDKLFEKAKTLRV
eukprot:TRINITY_DN3401_c0_g2_i3.p1 TRINITY_DN3401_c0_g2~~TRINITY_DN3401_c0_g2_i3.p1  ORF type:complete len:419 (+),score=156.83 TRINITY_DN3401_c0_g2_i3:115-1371(+)